MFKKKVSLEEVSIIQEFYNLGNGLTACQKKFGYSRSTLIKYLITRRPYNCKVSEEDRQSNKLSKLSYRQNCKSQMIQYKGGKCIKCNYNKCNSSLDFHHRDQKQKEINISESSLSFNNLKDEINKCDLLCKNCHAETHELLNKRNEDELEGVLKWRRTTKNRILDSFNRQCGICHYSKSNDGLHLHHLNPVEKEYTISKLLVNPNKWETIVTELRKCVLLCANCHYEVHSKVTVIDIDHITRFNEEFFDYSSKIEYKSKITDQCKICGEEKLASLVTCSYECAHKKRRQFDWSKIDLQKVYEQNNMNLSAVAREIGCSNTLVKRYLVRLGILK